MFDFDLGFIIWWPNTYLPLTISFNTSRIHEGRLVVRQRTALRYLYVV